jgi:hypothetical protein
MKEITPGTTIRPHEDSGYRATYRPDWDSIRPWISYVNGTAGKHFRNVNEIEFYFQIKFKYVNPA